MENSDYSAKPYIVNLDVVGPLTVYVQVGKCRLLSLLCRDQGIKNPAHPKANKPAGMFQGDLEKFKDGVVFLTVHGAGSSFNSWLDFAGDESMQDIRKR
jgi:hypothetical protein